MGKQECDEEKWILSNSVKNEDVAEDDDEEESLSLCDLPNKEEKQSKKESPRAVCSESQEDFDFCWWGGSSLKESEMCAADEVFFQGQILPLRHSISSDGSLARIFRNNGHCISRLESMDRCHSFGYTSGSSRSSSIRSHRSSSSGSSSTNTPTIHSKYYNGKTQPRSHFNSSPSQTPQVRFSKVSHANVNNNCSRKSTFWSLFRVSLVAMPEIALQDLKIRNNNSNNNYKVFGSRNSSNSDANNRVSVKRSLKQRFSDKNMILFGTCRCSVNDVQTAPPRTAAVGRNSSVKEGHEDKKGEATKVMRKLQQTAGKQAMSRLRTFEWLKQLSLEGPATL